MLKSPIFDGTSRNPNTSFLAMVGGPSSKIFLSKGCTFGPLQVLQIVAFHDQHGPVWFNVWFCLMGYPLLNQQSYGKSPLSITMLVYQRLSHDFPAISAQQVTESAAAWNSRDRSGPGCCRTSQTKSPGIFFRPSPTRKGRVNGHENREAYERLMFLMNSGGVL